MTSSLNTLRKNQKELPKEENMQAWGDWLKIREGMWDTEGQGSSAEEAPKLWPPKPTSMEWPWSAKSRGGPVAGGGGIMGGSQGAFGGRGMGGGMMKKKMKKKMKKRMKK